MSPSLEQYSPYSDVSSFSSFDVIENTQFHSYKISFVLNHPINLRIDTGGIIEYCIVNGRAIGVKGPAIVTGVLDTGKEHTVTIQIKPQTA
jgi:hypothetical protein